MGIFAHNDSIRGKNILFFRIFFHSNNNYLGNTKNYLWHSFEKTILFTRQIDPIVLQLNVLLYFFYECCLENSGKIVWYHDNKIWGQFSVDVLHCHLAPICNILSGKVGKTSPHYGCFLEFLSKKYLRQMSILGTNE